MINHHPNNTIIMTVPNASYIFVVFWGTHYFYPYDCRVIVNLSRPMECQNRKKKIPAIPTVQLYSLH